MPSAVEQGAMATDQLRASAAGWGGQLTAAGVNVDLAPVTDTVPGDRQTNEPIGALDRDFGLDAAGNAAHAAAFVAGMRDAGVQSSIKHYPGLGAVKGNTDFTTDGILDTTTTADGAEIGAFHTVISQAKPAMVMMSLATYQSIDADDPAAFSHTIVDGLLRGRQGFDGVVTSDSLSAAAVSGTPTDQLGVRFVEAGGDQVAVVDRVERAAHDADAGRRMPVAARGAADGRAAPDGGGTGFRASRAGGSRVGDVGGRLHRVHGQVGHAPFADSGVHRVPRVDAVRAHLRPSVLRADFSSRSSACSARSVSCSISMAVGLPSLGSILPMSSSHSSCTTRRISANVGSGKSGW